MAFAEAVSAAFLATILSVFGPNPFVPSCTFAVETFDGEAPPRQSALLP